MQSVERVKDLANLRRILSRWQVAGEDVPKVDGDSGRWLSDFPLDQSGLDTIALERMCCESGGDAAQIGKSW